MFLCRVRELRREPVSELVAKNVRHGMLGIMVKVVVVRLKWACVVIFRSRGEKFEPEALFSTPMGYMVAAPGFVHLVVVPQGGGWKEVRTPVLVGLNLPSPHCNR